MRRLVYLMIKALCEQTKSEEVLVVTASLCQDINSKIDTFRSNAIRVLAKVLDVRSQLQLLLVAPDVSVLAFHTCCSCSLYVLTLVIVLEFFLLDAMRMITGDHVCTSRPAVQASDCRQGPVYRLVCVGVRHPTVQLGPRCHSPVGE
jgi:hypothetical protein